MTTIKLARIASQLRIVRILQEMEQDRLLVKPVTGGKACVIRRKDIQEKQHA